MKLRALRKSKDLTRGQLEDASGLDQFVTSRLESPSGAFPKTETIEWYVEACGGEAGVVNSPDAFSADVRELVV